MFVASFKTKQNALERFNKHKSLKITAVELGTGETCEKDQKKNHKYLGFASWFVLPIPKFLMCIKRNYRNYG